jgi:hypothetical protein
MFFDIPLYRLEINEDKISLDTLVTYLSPIPDIEISFIPLFKIQQHE